VLSDGRVVWSGPSSQAAPCDAVLHVDGACVLPGFVDSHTHLVFGGDRAEEFQARLAGAPYTAGGIRSTVSATRATSTADLTARAVRLAREACGPVRRRSRSRAGTA